LAISTVTQADPAHIAEVVEERGQDGMDPVLGRNASGKSQSPQNVLGDQSDKSCVLGIVIKSVTAGESFDNQSPRFIQQGGKVEFATAEGPAKHMGQILAERVRQQRGCIQHDAPPDSRDHGIPHGLAEAVLCIAKCGL
jgi:hypothetical protein